MLYPHPHFPISLESYIDGGIKLLKYIGSLVDKFLESEEDFWLFDYIVNVVCANEENRLNAYHTFKVMSLIEMIIVNPKNGGRTQDEVENKLSPIFTK